METDFWGMLRSAWVGWTYLGLGLISGFSMSAHAAKPTDSEVDTAIHACSAGQAIDAKMEGGLQLLRKRIVGGGGAIHYSEIPSVIGSSVSGDEAKTMLFEKIQNCIVKNTYGSIPTPRSEFRDGPNVSFGCGDSASSPASYTAPSGFHIVSANATIVAADGTKSSSAAITSQTRVSAAAVANFQGRDREWTGNCPGGGHGAVRLTVDIGPD